MSYSNSYLWILIIVLVGLLLIAYIINSILIKKYRKAKKDILREGDSRYLELINKLPQLVIETDSDGKFTFINKQGLEFLGYGKFDIGKIDIFSIIHPSSLSKFKEEFLYLVEGGENKGQEYRIITNRNDNYFMVFYLRRIIINANNEIGLRGIIIDISDRKELERKVLNTIIETEDKERRRFSEDLHDGLGPLLSTVKLYINQMKSSKVSISEEKEMFNFANELLDEAISTTRNIANNILPGSIVDNGLIAGVRTFITHIKQAGNIDIVFNENLSKRYDTNIEINIYRIIIELINNSLKYAEANTLEVCILEENNTLNVQYKDDGKGFNMEEVKEGLGHINIENRSKSINGEFDYYSEINKGMTFNLKVEV